MRHQTLLTSLMSAVALSAFVAVPVHAADDPMAAAAPKAEAPKTETCFGVAKAGKNDCGNGAHSCATQSTKDSAGNEWVKVPAGLCAKLAGGSTTAAK